jgi:hypothetical protein
LGPNDAFGIYTFYKHSGDFNAAAKELARLGYGSQTNEKVQKAYNEIQTEVILIRGSEIKPEPIGWLWEGWLARGKLHILAGAPGTGKTTIALSLAATITKGGRYPDGAQEEVPGSVVVWSGEDGIEDTLYPRALAMGADPEKLLFVGDVRNGKSTRAFDPAHDMNALLKTIENARDVKLLIVDPVVNAVSGDSHKNTEVRRALQPIVDLAARLDIAIIGISHFSKGTSGNNPVERVTGSIAFSALARVVFAVAKIEDNDGKGKSLLTRAKSNIGPDGGGFYYSIEQVSVPGVDGVQSSAIVWQEAVAGGACELLAKAENTIDMDEQVVLSETQQWLKNFLLDVGTIDKKEIMKLARKNYFSERTIQRARKKLGITYEIKGFGGDKKSMWSLPLTTNPANHA